VDILGRRISTKNWKIKKPKTEYEIIKHQIAKLRQLEKLDLDLIRHFKDSLEDVKAGRIRRVD